MNRKWTTEKETENKDLRVYLCVSRNKDNDNIENFKQRRMSFLAYDGKDSIEKRFKEFVRDGVIGEKADFINQ